MLTFKICQALAVLIATVATATLDTFLTFQAVDFLLTSAVTVLITRAAYQTDHRRHAQVSCAGRHGLRWGGWVGHVSL